LDGNSFTAAASRRSNDRAQRRVARLNRPPAARAKQARSPWDATGVERVRCSALLADEETSVSVSYSATLRYQ
jgi:hypothetical protein